MSSPNSQFERIDGRQIATLALVGVLLLSGVGGALAGSSGTAAAQQAGSNGTNTTGGAAMAGGNGSNVSAGDPVNATIEDFKNRNLGYSNLSASKKEEVREILEDLNQKDDLSQTEISISAGKINRILALPTDKNGTHQIPSKIIKENFNSEEKDEYPSVGPDINIPDLMDGKLKSLGNSLKEGAGATVKTIDKLAFSTPVPHNDGWHGILGAPTDDPADQSTVTDNQTNATPPPSAWNKQFGESTDSIFTTLYQNFLVDKIYPMTNTLLGLGVIVLALSLVVSPLTSRFRAWDLISKFVAFLLLYVGAWTAVTVMHGSVNAIVMWIRPSPETLANLATSVQGIEAGSVGAIGAFLVGSSGLMATLFGLAIILALRHILLLYFLPYIFPLLLLVLYLSPWQRLKGYASMVIWQYVNVLTMIIPVAILLKAATVVSLDPDVGMIGMVILVALFAAAATIPILTTWFFTQVKGAAAKRVKAIPSGVASRAGAAKNKAKHQLWGSGSSNDSTATGNTSTGDRTEEAVEAATGSSGSAAGSEGMSKTGTLDDETVENMGPTGGTSSATTAGRVRYMNKNRQRDPMNPTSRRRAYMSNHRAGIHGP